MINPFKDTNWRPDTAELRTFGRSLLVGFPGLAAVFSLVIGWRLHVWPAWPLWMAGVGALAGLLFSVVPALARPVYVLWYFLACCIGIVVSNVVMALLYYAVVTPVGICLRLCGRDPMRRKFDRGAQTYWLDAEKPGDAKSYFRQF